MRWFVYGVLVCLLGCEDAAEPEATAPPVPSPTTGDNPAENPADNPAQNPARSSAELENLPFSQRVFAELKPKLAKLTPVDACFEACRVTLVCKPSDVSQANELSKQTQACRERCNADNEAWKPRVGQARVCLSGPDCAAFGECMRGSGLAASATP